MTTVTSAQFQKAYGKYADLAKREPVTVTQHGRRSLVLMSVEDYDRLAAYEPKAFYAWEIDEATLAAIAAAKPPPESYALEAELAAEPD